MDVESAASFATLTHARLRAAQGDIAGAARILGVILEVQPEHDEARALLAQIAKRVEVVRTLAAEDVPAPVSPTTADDLRIRFRGLLGQRDADVPIDKLSRWLDHAMRTRGARRVR